jgi:hypothetical protein
LPNAGDVGHRLSHLPASQTENLFQLSLKTVIFKYSFVGVDRGFSKIRTRQTRKSLAYDTLTETIIKGWIMTADINKM